MSSPARSTASTRPDAVLAHHILDVDHLMCGVDDARAAGSTFSRLGFTVTPYSAVPSFGHANVLVCMRPRGGDVANFLELMALERPEIAPPAMRQLLSGPQGIKSLVLAVDDVEAHRAALVEDGYRMLDIWPVRRSWELHSGETLEFRFSVVLPEQDQVPVMFNGVEYATLEHYLRPEFQQHPNGAQRLTAVLIAAPANEVDRAAKRYADLFGTRPRRLSTGSIEVGARDVALRFVPAARAVELMPGMAAASLGGTCAFGFVVAVDDLDRAADALKAGDVPFRSADGGLRISPDHACGNLIEFRVEA